jgi:MgtE intracellular N domain
MARQASDLELTRQMLSSAVVEHRSEALARALRSLAATDAAALVLKLGRAQAADVLERMAPDDAADLVEELDAAQAEAILVVMEAPEAAEIRLPLGCPPQSAAGLMTQEVVTISPRMPAEACQGCFVSRTPRSSLFSPVSLAPIIVSVMADFRRRCRSRRPDRGASPLAATGGGPGQVARDGPHPPRGH